MLYLFSLLFGLNPNIIHIANSIDWLCYDANTIAIIKVESYHEEPLQDKTLSADCYITASITELYKGQKPLIYDHIVVYSRLAYIGLDKWKNLVGKEVLVFLKDLGCDKHCSYAIMDDNSGMILPDSPAPKALTGDFKMIMKKDSLINYVKNCIKKLEGKTAKPYYLEVPFETEAHGALYAGSACYLIVPDILYPKAKKGMSD
jgi:hypothetical protein